MPKLDLDALASEKSKKRKHVRIHQNINVNESGEFNIQQFDQPSYRARSRRVGGDLASLDGADINKDFQIKLGAKELEGGKYLAHIENNRKARKWKGMRLKGKNIDRVY